MSASGAAMSAERVDLTDVVGDLELPCEAGGELHSRTEGDEAAAWVVSPVKHCPAVRPHVLVCDPCLRAVLVGHGGYRCRHCGWSCRPLRHSISRFERLNSPPRRPGAGQ